MNSQQCPISETSVVASPVYLSFLAGVIFASCAWFIVAAKRPRHDATSLEDDSESSFLRRWVSMDDIKSRIGELPSLRRRTHWPWNNRSKQRSRSSSPAGNKSPQQQSSPETSGTTPPDSKSDFCIGSIFGLDVGGSLTKLVYFERKAEHSDSEFLPFRERIYRNSASAQAVLLARRGVKTMDDDHGLTSTTATARTPPPRLRSCSSADVWTPLRRRPSLKKSLLRSKNGLLHSVDSQEDIKNLNRLRQESVPDDLHLYARSVHIQQATAPRFHTTESMEDLLKEEQSLNPKNATNKDSSTMRKSKSMLDFSKSRNEALDRFYNFARRLDSYREGVKDHKLSFYSRSLGGELHFIRFETRRMQNAMDLIRTNNLHLNIREMGATGGGAHKYASQWTDELGIDMVKQDELDSLVAGMQFVLSTVVGECYTFRPHDSSAMSRHSSRDSSGSMSLFESNNNNNNSNHDIGAPLLEEEEEFSDDAEDIEEDGSKGDEWWWSRKVQRDAISYASIYPYLLVTIGTGVSILRVDGPRKHERISGSTIGGGTYWGLIRLLTEMEDFDSAMRLAEHGDPSKVDMMVGDIYGEKSDALEKIGLASNLVASSFGKLVSKEDPAEGLKEEDLARALLLMVTNNIGQVAYLNAKLYKTEKIFFVGSFLRMNEISQRRLSFAIDYWSKGEMEALFLEHEGYFGALGAFLLSQGIENGSEARLRTQKSMPASASHEDASSLHKRSNSSTALR